jgi:6-phosphogluconolactonase
MNKFCVIKYNARDWALKSAEYINNFIKRYNNCMRRINIVLTGGKSAFTLYSSWANLSDFKNLKNINFYYSDERCVSPDNPDSNYGMTMRSLFQFGVPSTCLLFPILIQGNYFADIAKNYEAILPHNIDLLILGVGTDGHIASIFPNSDSMNEFTARVVYDSSVKSSPGRITITPAVIMNCKNKIIIAPGEEKDLLLETVTSNISKFNNMPLKYAGDSLWLGTYI